MKIIAAVFLFSVIIVFSGYAVLYYFFNISATPNTIDSLFRKVVIRQHSLRPLFRLNQAGDARFDFAKDDQSTRLVIHIYYQKGMSLKKDTMAKVIEELKTVIKKPQGITVEEENLEENIGDSVDDEQLDKLIASHPAQWSSSTKTAVLQIFVLNKYSVHPSNIGLTGDASSIFLFMDPIKGVSNTDYSTTGAEVSTILHEFGHLIGAGHVADSDCIMSGKAESITDGVPANIHYCPYDLQEIQKALF